MSGRLLPTLDKRTTSTWKIAERIRLRAVKRTGELLKTYRTGPKGGPPIKNKGGDGSPVSQAEAGAQAGLSRDEITTAVRVANAAAADPAGFERRVNSDTPPTVAELAAEGTRSTSPPARGAGGAGLFQRSHTTVAVNRQGGQTLPVGTNSRRTAPSLHAYLIC